MRLLSKIASTVLVGIVILLMIDGYLSVRREINLFDSDMARDGILLGQTLRPLVSNAWRNGGDSEAFRVISQANRPNSTMTIRWVRLDDPAAERWPPRVEQSMLDSLTGETELSIKAGKAENGGYRYTYVGVPVSSGRAAIEIAETLVPLKSYTRNTVIRTGALVATLIVVSWLLLWILGIRFIGEPLQELVEKTKRVGRGDFSGDVEISGKDELSHLGSAMNEMCAQLERANETVHRETEARMEMLEQLRHSERLAMLGRLSSGIAHELGTPLNVIAGRANMIATEDLPRDEVVSFSQTIAEQAKRMTDIIHELLGFARRRRRQPSSTDINELADQIVGLLDPTARKEDVTLVLERGEGVPLVSADRSLIQQVLMNLVMNGIHAMPGGGRVTISTGVARARHRGFSSGPEFEYVTISVEDGGVGMSKEQLEQAFAPFFTTKEHGKGTGLGLSIAQGIVEEHDGWIEAHSEPGAGSHFIVYLPSEAEL